MRPAPIPTVAAAMARKLRVATHCPVCGAAGLVDLARLSARGQGRVRLSGMRVICECGSARRSVLVAHWPRGRLH